MTDAQSISIHALLAESDLMWYQCNMVVKEFLSTLSLRRATLQRQIEFERYSDISIHALLAESDVKDTTARKQIADISIHALLAESDPHIRSTSHGRRGISIHALLAESDGGLWMSPGGF